MARPVTSMGDRIAALASAGTLNLRSNQNETLTPSGCGFDLLHLADRYAQDADIVAGEQRGAVVEIADHFGAVGVADRPHRHQRTGDQGQRQTAARAVREFRSLVIADLRPGRRRAAHPVRGTKTGEGVGSGTEAMPGGTRPAGRAAGRLAGSGQRLPVRVAARGAGQRHRADRSPDRRGCR